MSSQEQKTGRKKGSPKIWQYYRVKDGSVTKLRRECPRCGRGVFLAEHSDRLSCGKCGWTMFKKK